MLGFHVHFCPSVIYLETEPWICWRMKTVHAGWELGCSVASFSLNVYLKSLSFFSTCSVCSLSLYRMYGFHDSQKSPLYRLGSLGSNLSNSLHINTHTQLKAGSQEMRESVSLSSSISPVLLHTSALCTLATPHGLWDPSFLTRDWSRTLSRKACSPATGPPGAPHTLAPEWGLDWPFPHFSCGLLTSLHLFSLAKDYWIHLS